MKNFFIFSANRFDWLFLFLIIAATALVRLNVIKNGNFPFWFDPGRDAVVSREILEKHDLKIQGPSASGTKDTVYHGVLYYYLIGPLYTWLGGDPQLVVNVLAILSSITVVAVFGLAMDISQDRRVGWLAAILYTASYDGVRGGTWISNPVLASVSIPFFFWLVWRVFFMDKTKEWPLLTLCLAVSSQSVIFFASHWLVVFAAAIFQWQQLGKKFSQKWQLPNIILGLVVYGLSISSMLLAQLKAWHDGVFSLAKLGEFAGSTSGEGVSAITGTLILFINKIIQMLLPTYPVAAIILAGVLLMCVAKQNKNVKTFWLLVFTAPLWLLAWHFRNMNHSLLGLETMACVLLANWLITMAKTKISQAVAVGILILFFMSQFSEYQLEKNRRSTVYYLPQGSFFHDQLAAIDYSYQIAAGQPFSISSITNPYGYNTLWSYLYNWYGQKKYGYQPLWFGPDQTGLFGGDLLTKTASPSAVHISIYEPAQGIPDYLIKQFSLDQNREAGTVSAAQNFGSILVETR